MILGLTGSMAAGKSTAAAILRKKGYAIIDADEIAHAILKLDEVKTELKAAFGQGIFTPDGEVEHYALSRAAFENGRTEQLNAITHPRIRKKLIVDAQNAEKEFGCAVMDVPLLIESGLNENCDFVLLITADIETRYNRIMKRDGFTRAQARTRLHNQMPQWKKKRYADYIIANDSDEEELENTLMEAINAIFENEKR